MGQMINVSADAIRAAEAGLIKKVRKHQIVFGEAHEEVVRLALLAVGDDRAADVGLEVDWENAEARSMAELADAATKKQAVGVPWRQNMKDLGYSPQEIDAMESERATDAMLSAPTLAAGALDPPSADDDTGDLKAKAEALGQLIRAGVDPDDAAVRVGLAGVKFTGAVPGVASVA
jgi:hypothetical protein